jgi:hypothetical protein
MKIWREGQRCVIGRRRKYNHMSISSFSRGTGADRTTGMLARKLWKLSSGEQPLGPWTVVGWRRVPVAATCPRALWLAS